MNAGSGGPSPAEPPVLWTPSAERVAAAHLTHFIQAAEKAYGVKFPDYRAFWQWSVDQAADFWRLLWKYCNVIGDGPGEIGIENPDRMPGARFSHKLSSTLPRICCVATTLLMRWCSGAKLKFAAA